MPQRTVFGAIVVNVEVSVNALFALKACREILRESEQYPNICSHRRRFEDDVPRFENVICKQPKVSGAGAEKMPSTCRGCSSAAVLISGYLCRRQVGEYIEMLSAYILVEDDQRH